MKLISLRIKLTTLKCATKLKKLLIFFQNWNPNFLINVKNLSTWLIGYLVIKTRHYFIGCFFLSHLWRREERSKLHVNEVCASFQKLMHHASLFQCNQKKSLIWGDHFTRPNLCDIHLDFRFRFSHRFWSNDQRGDDFTHLQWHVQASYRTNNRESQNSLTHGWFCKVLWNRLPLAHCLQDDDPQQPRVSLQEEES
jgi:hypothetical protein